MAGPRAQMKEAGCWKLKGRSVYIEQAMGWRFQESGWLKLWLTASTGPGEYMLYWLYWGLCFGRVLRCIVEYLVPGRSLLAVFLAFWPIGSSGSGQGQNALSILMRTDSLPRLLLFFLFFFFPSRTFGEIYEFLWEGKKRRFLPILVHMDITMYKIHMYVRSHIPR